MSLGFDALILAGGRGTRLGGANKPGLMLHGQRLVDRVIQASRQAGAARVLVIGDQSTGTLADGVLREDPPFAGPLAGIAAGIAQVSSPWCLILACDLQHPDAVIRALLGHLDRLGADGVVLRDAQGYTQWLAGFYRTQAVAQACAELGDRLINAPARTALGQLDLAELPVDDETTNDIDTPQALERARHDERP
ncbi:molybdenum cofactor guanylyltransferase [Glutamicibacter mishrai]|uniref:molybdenum cofactor guanylyltransferase n=1 Tax=Glutamicibacter mishrai TaxID=1775880 RepID=UPI0020CF4B50|nr:molybdenum cofactor guanylyltransferase [Glutamicibacter mishrai]UTT40188.1 molybdenum cofactor guanylyltransferase [Glutamicibacter mishrai]